MPGRTRLIKPSFWYDEDLGRVSRDARLLAIGLLTLADREGRLEVKLPEIRVRLFPYDKLGEKQLGGWLDELARARFILGYEVDGRKYLQIRNFARHQHCHPHEAKSLIPPPAVTCPDMSLHFLQGDVPYRGTCTSTSTSTTRPPSPENGTTEATSQEVGSFIKGFCEAFKAKLGATYVVKRARDVPNSRKLLQAFPLARALLLADIMFDSDEPFIAQSDRGIGVLLAKASWLDVRLADYERRHGKQA